MKNRSNEFGMLSCIPLDSKTTHLIGFKVSNLGEGVPLKNLYPLTISLHTSLGLYLRDMGEGINPVNGEAKILIHFSRFPFFFILLYDIVFSSMDSRN